METKATKNPFLMFKAGKPIKANSQHPFTDKITHKKSYLPTKIHVNLPKNNPTKRHKNPRKTQKKFILIFFTNPNLEIASSLTNVLPLDTP